MRNVQLLPSHQYYYEQDGKLLVGEYSADTLRAQKLAAVVDWQLSQQDVTLTVGENEFDFNQTSYSVALGYLMTNSLPETWTDAHNNEIPVTLEFMQSLVSAMTQHISQTHSKQRRMKNELNNITSAADIAAYEVSTA